MSTLRRVEQRGVMTQLTGGKQVQRLCPTCGASSATGFLAEKIDPERLTTFAFASRKSPEFMRLKLDRCLACDTIYAPTHPEEQYLSSNYATAEYDSGVEAHCAAESYMKALSPYLVLLPDKSMALDVGAGNGAMLPLLLGHGFSDVCGIEPSHMAINNAPPEIRRHLREGMFTPALVSDLWPSLICAFMTLEHLSDPGDFVRAVHGALHPGGLLAVITHNWRAPLNRLLGQYSPIIDIEHLQLFSPGALRVLMEQNGFKVLHQGSIWNRYPLAYWVRLMPLPQKVKSIVLGVVAACGLSSLLMTFPVGNMLTVCQRS